MTKKTDKKPAPKPVMPICPTCKRPAVHCVCNDNELKK